MPVSYDDMIYIIFTSYEYEFASVARIDFYFKNSFQLLCTESKYWHDKRMKKGVLSLEWVQNWISCAFFCPFHLWDNLSHLVFFKVFINNKFQNQWNVIKSVKIVIIIQNALPICYHQAIICSNFQKYLLIYFSFTKKEQILFSMWISKTFPFVLCLTCVDDGSFHRICFFLHTWWHRYFKQIMKRTIEKHVDYVAFEMFASIKNIPYENEHILSSM